MRLQIFDVEHGACALLTCDDGKRIMIDCGHNATTGWRPGTYLNSVGVAYLDKLVITNYDEDHVSGAPDLFDKVSVGCIVRNTSVSPADITRLKSEDGMGAGIERLVWELERNFLPPGTALGQPPVFQGVTETYFHHYPYDFDDENNLSLVLKLNCMGANLIFPGDLETAGWLKMLNVPGFIPALQNMDVFVASHHGRESGCCEDIFKHFKPRFVVISDKSKGYQTQETTGWYSDRALGGIFNGDNGRKVVTTRSDGDLVIEFANTGYLFRKDPQSVPTRSAADFLLGLTALASPQLGTFGSPFVPPPQPPARPNAPGLGLSALYEPPPSPPPESLASLLLADPNKPKMPLSALAAALRKP